MSLQKDSECLPGTRYSRCSNKDAVQPSTGKVGEQGNKTPPKVSILILGI